MRTERERTRALSGAHVLQRHEEAPQRAGHQRRARYDR